MLAIQMILIFTNYKSHFDNEYLFSRGICSPGGSNYVFKNYVTRGLERKPYLNIVMFYFLLPVGYMVVDRTNPNDEKQ